MIKSGDRVRVEYQYNKFYTGVVLWEERSGAFHWVTVKPDNVSMICTFGSARDMGRGYKSYMSERVSRIEE